MPPKTPSRQRARSDAAKTPLTPSVISGLNNVFISSPTKAGTKSGKYAQADTTNPFLSRGPSRPSSRAPSPVKRATTGAFAVSDTLQRQASAGVVRKGGIEAKLNVVSRDYAPPPKAESKRSRSTPAMVTRDARDRFITSREDVEVAPTFDAKSLNPESASPGHTARLVAATGVPLNKRVLAFHEAPPPAADSSLAKQREIARPLYARPGETTTSTGTTTNKSRKIATVPFRVLDAPGIVDDFYLNLLSWSSLNAVAIGLGDQTYIWKADSGEVVHVGEAPEGSYVSSVDFSGDGAFLGVGLGTGEVELWDVEMGQKLRTMTGHQHQVATLSWNGHVLSSGCGDGSIWHHDVRIARHKVMELLGHTGEVCGLAWREDGEFLASGGNDNVVNIWDGRVGDVTEGSRGVAKWTKRNHTAAVKAVAWCPWQPSLLATGGGTSDATIHIWNSMTGARLHSLKTPSQVSSVQWSPHRKEILSTHGIPTNSIMVHSYPSFECVAEIRDAHDARVLFSCISPAGDVVCTGAGDENLKFWRIWEAPEIKKKKGVKEARGGVTGSGILALR